MGILTTCGCLDVLVILIVLVVPILWYVYSRRTYWQRMNIPISDNLTLIMGHAQNPFKERTEHFSLVFKKWYDTIKSRGHKHLGIYFYIAPAYIPISLEYVKNIMSVDFNYFVDRGTYYNEKDDPISAHLFAVGGTKWRNLRVKLTPTFTSGKLKMMFQTLVECGCILDEQIGILASSDQPVDIKDMLSRFTTDIIGSCAFGLDCNSFNEDDSPFRRYGQTMFKFTRSRHIQLSFASNFPNLARALGVRMVEKETSDFFTSIVKKTIEFRETTKTSRKDFLQILIDLNHKCAVDQQDLNLKEMTLEEIVAQSYVFFLAGFETSSTLMTFTLFELAQNQHIQDKVRNEIFDVLKKHNGEITYDAIADMKYMQQVIEESLRKYPPVGAVTREAVKDYQIPDTDAVIRKGTRIFIPIYAIHHDEEYYPNPEKFDPERFTPENKQNMKQFAYLPFGEGPRICIGLRFGLMQTKVGLTSLLNKYRFSVNSKTKLPLKISPSNFTLTAVGDIWLDAKKL